MMTGMRPAAAPMNASAIERRSSCVSEGNSPVEPIANNPAIPFFSECSTSIGTFSGAIEPSSCIGVNVAATNPLNLSMTNPFRP